ncbi:hypothetical protein OG589_14100 [Sphaerisporangium sp. NBC_01403]|uniref:hypothetical protein n=1 Tax=Sphaerisporangium sp. NBC_01403 TaxID=2903599 RepID=UPI00324B34BD
MGMCIESVTTVRLLASGLAGPDLRRARGDDRPASDPTYSEPIVRAWNQKAKEADAFIVIPRNTAAAFRMA